MIDGLTIIAEAFFHLCLGGLGYAIYVGFFIAGKWKHVPRYKAAYKQNKWRILEVYWDENPGAHSASILWVVAISMVGDMSYIRDFLPVDSGRHMIFLLNGIGAETIVGRIVDILTPKENNDEKTN